MKKLMTVAISAFSAAVAFGDVVSSDVVGYTGAALRGGNQAAGVGGCFINVDGSNLTLGDLTVVGYDTADGYADFEVQAKQLNGFGVGGTTYYWCDFEEDEVTYKGWYDEDMNEYNNLNLVAGEGLWVYSPDASFKIQSAGAVAKTSISVTLRGGNQAKMVSNPMPATLTLGDISVDGYDKGDGYADFEIQAKKLNGFGVGGTTYYWCDFEEEEVPYYGWYDEDMNDYNDVEVSAGEGLWIYSPSTDFSVVFPSPL